jgi:hypothetical protein
MFIPSGRAEGVGTGVGTSIAVMEVVLLGGVFEDESNAMLLPPRWGN